MCLCCCYVCAKSQPNGMHKVLNFKVNLLLNNIKISHTKNLE